jgi:hypothetical protein
MNMRLILAVASVAALCSCGGSKERDRDRDNGRDRDRSESSNSSREDTARADTGSSSSNSSASSESNGGGSADPQLVREIAQAVEMIRPQLPIRQGPVTIDNIEANGAELIYHMRLPNDIDDAGFGRFEQALPQQACGDNRARELFRRGGAYTYRLTDSEGEEFTTTIRSC